jgi:hypothetical protein
MTNDPMPQTPKCRKTDSKIGDGLGKTQLPQNPKCRKTDSKIGGGLDKTQCRKTQNAAGPIPK